MKIYRMWLVAGGLAATSLLQAAQPPASLSSVPEYINYQGRLVSPSGAPYSNATHAIELRLYETAGGGDVLWGEEYTVKTQDGYFSVLLGSGGTPLAEVTPEDLWRVLWREGGGSPDTYFMGVTVLTNEEGDELLTPVEATPRQQFVSSPFAMRAHQSRFADGAVEEFQAPAGINTPSMTSTSDIVVTASVLISGANEALHAPTVQSSRLEPQPNTDLDIIGYSGKSVDISANGGPLRLGVAYPDGSPTVNASSVQVGYYSGSTLPPTYIYGGDITVRGAQGETVGINAKDGNVYLGYTPTSYGHVIVPSYGPDDLVLGHATTDVNIQYSSLAANGQSLFKFQKVYCVAISGQRYAEGTVSTIDSGQYDLMAVGFSTTYTAADITGVYLISGGKARIYYNSGVSVKNGYVRVLGIRKGLTSGFTY